MLPIGLLSLSANIFFKNITIICFVESRLNGFKLSGTAENGTKLLIYSDQALSPDRSEIFLDSTKMFDVAVKEITIEIPATSAILTLCEVYVYGRIDI